jgi:hypothetical protein
VQLLRFAEVSYGSNLPESWAYFSYESGPVRVTFRAQRNGPNAEIREHLVSAEVDIDLPVPNNEGLIEFPDEPRRECERAIV